MSTNGEYLVIDSITFESGDLTALLKGRFFKGNLNYNSEIEVTQSVVNTVINELQKINPEFSVMELFESIPMLDSGRMYISNFTDLLARKIDFLGLVQPENIREIRA